MAYLVIQPVRDHRYVYLTRNQYVPEKHSSRNQRTCLGKLVEPAHELWLGADVPDPSADVQAMLTQAGIAFAGQRMARRTAARRHPEEPLQAIVSLGEPLLLRALATQSGLAPLLQEVFGPRDGPALLALAMHQVCTGEPLYLFEAWHAGLPPTCQVSALDGSSAGLSRLMARLGEDVATREAFFRAWLTRQGNPEALVYDTTSLSTYAAGLDLAEWGYNRDGEALPQINLALVADQQTHLPLYYRLLPGSLPDVATLQTTLQHLVLLGLTHCTCVLDRGFYSQANVRALVAADLSFLLAVPFTNKQAQRLRQTARRALTSAKRSLCYRGQIVRHHQAPWLLPLGPGETRLLTAHLFWEPARAAEQAAALERRVFLLEEQAARETFTTRPVAWDWLKEQAPTLTHYVRLEPDDTGVHWVRKPQAIMRACHQFGYLLVLTDDAARTPLAVLGDYRQRDGIEKLLDIWKNELAQARPHSGERRVVEGRFLLAFIALILYRTIETRLTTSGLITKYSVAEVLAELRKLKAVILQSGKQLALEMTKKQRTILEAIDVNIFV